MYAKAKIYMSKSLYFLVQTVGPTLVLSTASLKKKYGFTVDVIYITFSLSRAATT